MIWNHNNLITIKIPINQKEKEDKEQTVIPKNVEVDLEETK